VTLPRRIVDLRQRAVERGTERSGAERNFQRIGQEQVSGIHAVDVVCTTDPAHFIDWRRNDWVAPFVPEDVARHFPAEHVDPDGMHAVLGAWLETINYNTKLVTGADAPKSCRLIRRASRAVVCVLHAVVVIPMASKPSESQAANSLWARAMPRQTTPHRYSAPVSGILAPQRVSNLRIVTKL